MIFLVLLLSATASADFSSRIIGGSNAGDGYHPHQMVLQVRRGGQWYLTCGASLIDSNWAITAAHCTKGTAASSMRLVLNEVNRTTTSNNEVYYGVSKKIEHESYTDNANDFLSLGAYPNDIALLRLSQAADQSNVITLASDNAVFDNQKCVISGWGVTSLSGSVADVLQEVEIDVLTEPRCKQTWGAYINSGHICVHSTGKGACNGDSGGPLTCKEGGMSVLAGVTSWVAQGCVTSGGSTSPSVYGRVSYFREWIDANMV